MLIGNEHVLEDSALVAGSSIKLIDYGQDYRGGPKKKIEGKRVKEQGNEV